MPSRATASSQGGHDLPARRAESAQLEQDPLRATIMEAMLTAVGERGYREVSVQNVLDLYGGHRVQFWQHFANKEECFAAACEARVGDLVTELLTAALGEDGWRRGVRAGLACFFRFVEQRPAISRALLIETEVAGGAALAKREEAVERLGEALDAGRAKSPAAEQPPPLTGLFVAGGIATYAAEQLAAGVVRFAVGPYLGEEAAEEELEATAVFLQRRAEEGRPR